MEWREVHPPAASGRERLPRFDVADGVWARLKRKRIAMLSLLIVLGSVMPGIPKRPVLLAVLAANLLLTLVLSSFVSPRYRYVAWWIQLTAMVVVVAIFIPEFWTTSVMCVVAVGIWAGLGAGQRVIWAIMGPAFAGLLALGIIHNPNVWAQHLVMALTLTALTWHITEGVRDQVADNEAVLERSLSTSSSFVHVGELGTNRFSAVIGPVEAITGWTERQWLDLDVEALIHPDDTDGFWIDPEDAEPGFAVERQARFRTATGDWVWLRDVSQVLRDTDGRLFLRGFMVDVTEIEKANQLIRRQARQDALTGLPNRTHYVDELHSRLVAGQCLSVIVMDIDRFKAINDTLGHAFGDQVLVEMADRLSRTVATDDVVARLSGDEFAIISAGSNTPAGARREAEAIAAALSRPMQIKGMSISRTVSVGIAIRADDDVDAATLMRQADMAMYEAKHRRRTVQVFTGDIHQTPLEEVTLSASLRDALADDQFILHYQPKVDLTTGTVTGFEGLARWQHPTLGLLTPNRFIDLLTCSDEGQAFADHVIEAGVRFACRCRDEGRPVPVSVNMSARSLFDEGLPERVARLLQRHEVPASLLIIEITEADIMEEASHSSRVLERLSDLGVQISIDDFGTGYSSLARLVDLPINEIKIDRRFVCGAQSNERDRVIVRSIVDLAATLDLGIIGEGVEFATDIELLLDAGCEEAQGFLFARPVPEPEALGMLDSVFETVVPSSAHLDPADHSS